ncbi:tumor necrosis factor ligand superfamily member 15 [Centroberyx gerrardi]
MGRKPQDEVALRDVEIGARPDESLLVLLEHCRDMKRQETRLRLATLFLLFSCSAVFIFCIHQSPAFRGQAVAAELGTAYSKQDNFMKDCPQTNLTRPSIHLTSVESDDDKSNGAHIKWNATLGEKYYNSTERAIVIPQPGIYYVYLRIALCWNGDYTENPEYTEDKRISIKLHIWKDSYQKDVPIMEALDGIATTGYVNRNVYLGQVFELKTGDLLRVWIGDGYELIDIRKTSFGALLL